MTDSFVFKSDYRRQPQATRRKVLVTGASGKIGSYFAEHSRERYDLTLMVWPAQEAAMVEKFGDVFAGSLDDLDLMRRRFAGQDAIIHLAADPSPDAKWESLLPNNIVGTYNAFTAAADAGCRRFVYASSIHAVGGYPPGRQVHTHDPVNPPDLYGVTKCFGEALGRYMAEQRGLSTICVRIGAFQPVESARQESGLHMLEMWVSQRDLCHLLQCCIDNEDLQFAIIHGLSGNRFVRMDIVDTVELVGYRPQDDLARENVRLRGLKL